MDNKPEIISISVNYRQFADQATEADKDYSVVIPIAEPKAKEALEVLGFSVSESGVENDRLSNGSCICESDPYRVCPIHKIAGGSKPPAI